MEYLKSVIPVIESNYVNFTTVERSIADFFIYNREQMDFSAKSVAGKLFVSEASLSRFAKKCGFRGYREFIYQYEENFVPSVSILSNQMNVIVKECIYLKTLQVLATRNLPFQQKRT